MELDDRLCLRRILYSLFSLFTNQFLFLAYLAPSLSSERISKTLLRISKNFDIQYILSNDTCKCSNDKFCMFRAFTTNRPQPSPPLIQPPSHLSRQRDAFPIPPTQLMFHPNSFAPIQNTIPIIPTIQKLGKALRAVGVGCDFDMVGSDRKPSLRRNLQRLD